MDDPIMNDSGALIDTYRRHLSRGRALFGQVSGGLSEVASEGAWVITADGRLPARDTFAWTVLSALAGEVDAEVGPDDRVSIVLYKRRGTLEPA